MALKEHQLAVDPNSLLRMILRITSRIVSIAGINGDNSYSPNPVKIQKGQTVTWYNGDAISHTVTSGLDGDTDEGRYLIRMQ